MQTAGKPSGTSANMAVKEEMGKWRAIWFTSGGKQWAQRNANQEGWVIHEDQPAAQH